MANREEIMARLTRIVRDIVDDDDVCITETTVATDIEGWDSLTHITICVALEQEFNITLTAPEVAAVAKTGDLIDLICDRSPNA